MRSTFVGWLAQVLIGLGLVLVSANVAWIFAAGWWQVAVGCAVVASLGIALIVWAEHTERPQRLVYKARRTLSFPTQWAIKFGKRMPNGSTVAVAVIRSDGVRFVIDIRGDKVAAWGTPSGASGHRPLVGANRKRFSPDPLPALLHAAEVSEATPVLWLPEAKEPTNLRDEETKLLVVMGNARDLKHALQSAEIAPIRRSPKVNAAPTNAPTDNLASSSNAMA
jgi:hypothetical protein